MKEFVTPEGDAVYEISLDEAAELEQLRAEKVERLRAEAADRVAAQGHAQRQRDLDSEWGGNTPLPGTSAQEQKLKADIAAAQSAEELHSVLEAAGLIPEPY